MIRIISLLEEEGRKEIVDKLIGHKIKKIRLMTAQETEAQGWQDPALVIELDNGIKLFPSSDGEGNDHGMMFGSDPTTGSDFALVG